MTLLVADVDRLRAVHFFAEDRDIDYPAAALRATVEPVPGGQRVTVTAETILRDLTLFPDRLDPAATVDEALVTLLPGETCSFHVTGDFPDPSALTRRPVLRCVNDLFMLSARS
jgi:beta-mannosidase